MTEVELTRPCKVMDPYIRSLNAAEILLGDAAEEFNYHKTEVNGRAKQVEILKRAAQIVTADCYGCNQFGVQEDPSFCPALVAYQDIRGLTVAPLTTGIGQDRKINMGFGSTHGR